MRYGMPVMSQSSSQGRGPLYRLYEGRLRRSLQGEPLPAHVAVILDGNRRWARQRGGERVGAGHRAGAAKILEFLRWCDAVGVSTVTLYLLSTENLSSRPKTELDELVGIIGDLAQELVRARRRVSHVGDAALLPPPLAEVLAAAEQRSAKRKGIRVNLAVGYGGRHEIADAVRSLLLSHGREGGTLDELADLLTPDLIAEHLYTGGQPDPDLVIRTSGEQRLSGFLLWQSAHSEFYFTEALWPAFREIDFLRALRDYAGRHRRFGG